jgi:HemY protein
MGRVILVLLAGVAFVALAWFLAAIPGYASVTIGDYSVQASVPVAIVALVALVVALTIVLRLVVGVWLIPGSTARWRRQQRLRVGQRAVNRVLLALAAGEQADARRNAQRARRLLGDSPQTLLLAAEAGRMAGREDEAQAAFRTLADRADGRFLGLRGLLRQAIDRRDWAEAATIAKQAEEAHPGSVWLREQRTELALQAEHWGDAIELIGPGKKRTVYTIAAAEAEPDKAKALKLAREAWKQDPSFVPAVLAYARRLREGGWESRAKSAVQEAWAKSPHPELAAFYIERLTDKLARMQAAKQLVDGRSSHAESRLLLARCAIDAGLLGEARRQLDLARAEGLNQRRLSLMMADLEELQHGETEAGRAAMRTALRQAAAADPDPQWQCDDCRGEQVAWTPKCAFCGHVGTLHWSADAPAAAKAPAMLG